MRWISKLKDRKYYIDFDSGCVYENDTVVAEITSPTHINILLYFYVRIILMLFYDGILIKIIDLLSYTSIKQPSVPNGLLRMI